MRITFLLIISFIASIISANAQVVVERSVIGSSGGSFQLNGGITLEQTMGESVTGILQEDNITLTQGFHQPFFGPGLLSFEVETIASSCPTSSDGSAFLASISGCTPPYEVLWSNGVVNEDSLDRLLPGLYSVTITSGFCEETVEFEIEPGPAANCEIRIFNAFTPNGDGKSDVWLIENIDLPEYRENEVQIFNRWGQEVYSANNYNNSDRVWTGESPSGNKLQSGTYFYVIEAGTTTFKGYIELIR